MGKLDWSSEESAREIQSAQKVPDLFKQEYPGRGAVHPNCILGYTLPCEQKATQV